MSSGRSLFRRSAVALAAAGFALATVVAAVHPAELVLSQGQDTEAAQANVAASWPVAYASGQASSVKTISSNLSAGFESSYRWQVKNYDGNSGSSQERNVDLEFRDRDRIVDSSPATNSIVQDSMGGTAGYRNWFGFPNRGNQFSSRVNQSVKRCLFVAGNYQPVAQGSTGPCNADGGTMAAAQMQQPAFGFSISEYGLTRGNLFVNAWGLDTSVKCGISSASAVAPQGNIDISHELGSNNAYPAYEKTTTNDWHEVWKTSDGSSKTLTSELNTYDAILLASKIGAKVRPMVRRITQQNPPYALSELGVYIETYATPILGSHGFRSKFYMLLSRSECGVRNVTTSTNRVPPPRQPNLPSISAFSNSNPATEAGFADFGDSLQSAPLSPQMARLAAAGAAAGAGTEGTMGIKSSSPVDSATGVEVTTSAPPAGGDGDEDENGATAGSATSTSAGAGVDSTSDVIPEGGSETTGATATTTSPSTVPTVQDEPGRLPADSTFCESLEIDGEYVDAFTADECDAAARISAMSALEDYIADGEQDSRWKGFTSDDPEADGWRWAAIDQRTGHVVYVP